MAARARILRNGVLAGLLGAAVVAAWFLVYDTVRGRPFETPALLAAVLLHGASDSQLPSITAALVLQYTALHVVAFVLFGLAAAALIVAAEQEHGLIFALIIFFAAFEVFFLALVMFHGPALLAALSWWSILAGNLLATGVMLEFFFLRHRALGQALLGTWTGLVREGIVAGIIGAVTVAAWFITYDLIAGRPLYTPALLGAAILKGVRNPVALRVAADVVLGYSVLHGAAFVAFGIVAAVLLAITEREPLLLLGVFVLFTCFEVFFFGLVMLLDEALVEALGWWTIFVGNIFAAVAMLGYFLARHRGLRGRLVERWEDQQ